MGCKSKGEPRVVPQLSTTHTTTVTWLITSCFFCLSWFPHSLFNENTWNYYLKKFSCFCSIIWRNVSFLIGHLYMTNSQPFPFFFFYIKSLSPAHGNKLKQLITHSVTLKIKIIAWQQKKKKKERLVAEAHAAPDVWTGGMCIRRETNSHEPTGKERQKDSVLKQQLFPFISVLMKVILWLFVYYMSCCSKKQKNRMQFSAMVWQKKHFVELHVSARWILPLIWTFTISQICEGPPDLRRTLACKSSI